MNDLGNPRRTGFYAGAFESAQRNKLPIYAVAFRRSETSTVEIFKLDRREELAEVISALVRDGVALRDMWPVTMMIGTINNVLVEASLAEPPSPDAIREVARAIDQVEQPLIREGTVK